MAWTRTNLLYTDLREETEVGEQRDWMSCIPGMGRHFSPLYPRLDLQSSLSLKWYQPVFPRVKWLVFEAYYFHLILRLRMHGAICLSVWCLTEYPHFLCFTSVSLGTC